MGINYQDEGLWYDELIVYGLSMRFRYTVAVVLTTAAEHTQL